MAGIAGIQGNSESKKIIKKMLNAIKHRGPDNQKTYEYKDFACGVVSSHLSAKQKSGCAEKDGYTIFFDGEIYNERESGTSDAGVALDLFIEKGRTFASYLKGPFACAITDGEKIILARDSVGIRPLYWGKTSQGKICFASEIKALVGIADDINELLPSRILCSDSGISQFLPDYSDISIPFDFTNCVHKVRSFLIKAVKKRLEDNAVGGAFLSGGLDSTIITAIMHEMRPDLPAFTVGTEGASDVENAKIAAKYFDIEHHLHIYSVEEVLTLIPKAVEVLESFEEDCIIGSVANLIASEFAAAKTNCMLSGEGGDELFGGYHLLKELPSEDSQISMMNKLIAISYNTALQRLDRSMFGNSINYRTPFLDTDVITLALQIPACWKIHKQNGDIIEKYILREAFKDMIPKEIYFRKKLRFSRGTGTEKFLDKITEHFSSEIKEQKELKTEGGYSLHSKIELVYYKLFTKLFPKQYDKLVGRWDPNK